VSNERFIKCLKHNSSDLRAFEGIATGRLAGVANLLLGEKTSLHKLPIVERLDRGCVQDMPSVHEIRVSRDAPGENKPADSHEHAMG